MLARLKSQAFTLALACAVAAAWWLPEYGAKGGLLRSEYTTKACIVLAFFLQGLALRPKQLLSSAARFRLHLFCQSWIFLFTPIAMLLLVALFSSWIQEEIRVGLLFLAVLPTTISSSIILASNHRGDTATALFNATLSNILGVFLTPLWCVSLFSQASETFPPLGSLIASIAWLVLLPLGIGMAVRPFFREAVARAQPSFKRINNGAIVFVVYAAFANSVQAGVWRQFAGEAIAVAAAISALFLLIVSALAWTTSAIASPDPRLRIAAFFCASQKTLAAGVPMAALIFANANGCSQTSLVLLPLMIYHSLQLLLAGIVGPQLERRVAQAEP